MKNIMIPLAALGIALALSGCDLVDEYREGTELSKKAAGTNRKIPRVTITPDTPTEQKAKPEAQ
ncbi:hypothetical protein A1507_11730 [Methylomonas koyamae]|uniref:Lipoprotein n=1 Tax=Methylomonas koyamae TaxID=702114 RepID=A0A177NEX1_9GAMM|nr:hypothetical protein [Methylomonas koyamae]OAI16606.1 hypothetical protein A1507_11730 [Methylomonas koyamae]